ncbi:tail fiber assembly protein [Pantoea sp. JGM49]|uniref:tail fiber assembly protein n=1 Tax=Pantoea sp. JGM49 TaxID=2799791 RepID=UPI001BA82E9A|nr:tail fiber assembly protein [Pantoea sp. JGM49]MBS0881122.1 tail fiber assembly protein [Pantoea sp. JGM49]
MSDEKEVMLDEKGLAQSSGILTVYSFDPNTGLYSGSSQEFLTQGLGIPANATTQAPPADVLGKVCMFDNGNWLQVADHRGETVYSTVTGEAVTVTMPGDYPPNTTLLKPLTAFDKWGGIGWVTDNEAAKQAELSSAEAIKAELISEAGGIIHLWQTQLLLGMINDVDKASLTRWMFYIQTLQSIDLKTAPEIDWPRRPESF